MRYIDVELAYGDDFIYNDVRIKRIGGVEQVAADTVSTTAYGQRSLSRTSLLMPTDAEALIQAKYLLSRYKDPTLRVRSITLYPDADPVNLYPKVLAFDIGTRITLQLNQAGIDADYYIEGIRHDWDARRNLWVTKYQLSDIATSYGYQRFEYLNSGDNLEWTTDGNRWYAQTFIPSVAHTITSVKLKLSRSGTPGTVTIGIRATDGSGHPTGSDLISGTTNGNTLPLGPNVAGEWREIMLSSGTVLSASIKYALILQAPASGAIYVRALTPSAYSSGNVEWSYDSGVTWLNLDNWDLMFEEWGWET